MEEHAELQPLFEASSSVTPLMGFSNMQCLGFRTTTSCIATGGSSL